ncbi:Uncharacterised protein [Vibrio cholerae]|nr:Uncharacterised protein [Vibrio cholerae]
MRNFSTNIQVSIPAINTGTVTGAMRSRNSPNCQPAWSAMIRFCGSPTIVVTPPSAVPTPACISSERKNAR